MRKSIRPTPTWTLFAFPRMRGQELGSDKGGSEPHRLVSVAKKMGLPGIAVRFPARLPEVGMLYHRLTRHSCLISSSYGCETRCSKMSLPALVYGYTVGSQSKFLFPGPGSVRQLVGCVRATPYLTNWLGAAEVRQTFPSGPIGNSPR
jgi:hypothetical protein